MAIRAIERGDVKEGLQMFDDLIGAAATDEERADLRITKLICSPKDSKNMLARLETFPLHLRDTGVYQLWRGIEETNPIAAIAYLRKAIATCTNSFEVRMALGHLVQSEFRLGHDRSATKRLLATLHAEDRKLVGEAATLLARHLPDENVLGQMLLLVDATLEATAERYQNAFRYAFDNGFKLLALGLGELCVGKEDNGLSRLSRGLARQQLGLRSLAFEDYRASAAHGESVAKTNMAWLLNSGAVAEAGLEIFRAHKEDYGTEDPGAPYELRAALERSVEEERKKERATLANSDRAIKAILRIMEGYVHLAVTEVKTREKMEARGKEGAWALSVGADGITVALNGVEMQTTEVQPFDGLYAGYEAGTLRVLCVARGKVEALSVKGFAEDEPVEWLDFEGTSDSGSDQTDGS